MAETAPAAGLPSFGTAHDFLAYLETETVAALRDGVDDLRARLSPEALVREHPWLAVALAGGAGVAAGGAFAAWRQGGMQAQPAQQGEAPAEDANSSGGAVSGLAHLGTWLNVGLGVARKLGWL